MVEIGFRKYCHNVFEKVKNHLISQNNISSKSFFSKNINIHLLILHYVYNILPLMNNVY